MDRLGVLLVIAFRNLLASRMNVLIGSIVLGGTTLVLVGSALFDSLLSGMRQSVVGSVAGHVQVYSSKSREKLALFGDLGGEPDLSPIDDFPKAKALIEEHPNVRLVVPMGLGGSLMMSGNTIDLTLAKLREKVRAREAGQGGPELDPEIASLVQHVRSMAVLLRQDLENVRKLTAHLDPENVRIVELASGDEYWRDFDAHPYEKLELVENKLAQLMTDGDVVFIHYAGTDLQAFQQAFDRMEIVDGRMPPPGQRGILVAKFVYEENFKLKPAHRLDTIKGFIDFNQRKIAGDADLERRVKELSTQTREILYQLDPMRQRAMVERLQRALGTAEADPEKLLQQLFALTDENFEQRYRMFYEEVASLLELYRVRVGDDLTLTAQGRSGYVESAVVKVWGTFQFRGLEKSPLAGANSLLDLATFRDLYGLMSPAKLAEIRKLQEKVGATFVPREDAEAELFGEAAQVEGEAEVGQFDEAAALEGVKREGPKRTYADGELDRGVVLNAAILLKDPAALKSTLEELQAMSDREGLSLKVVDWEEAAGFLGQLTLVARLVISFLGLVIFAVAIVVINNAMMMATLQRVREIGTLRAIGGQKGFVVSMILVETAVLVFAFGLAGTALGAAVMAVLGTKGIPATREELYFFFSGPKLLPTLSLANVLLAFAVVFVVSVVSALYPALLATRVPPATAMGTAEE